jgi:hypothetical protein
MTRRACLLVLSSLFVSACGNGDVISLSPVETDLPRCAPAAARVQVTDLPGSSPVPCDIAGSTLVFPDGYEASLGPIGSNSGAESPGHAYAWTNLGVYGVVASARTSRTNRQWWGTDEAIQLAKEAGYGAELPDHR